MLSINGKSFKNYGTQRWHLFEAPKYAVWRKKENETGTSKVGAISKDLKAQSFYKIGPGRIYEKLRNQFRGTQRVRFMLDKARKPLFPPGNRKTFLKKFRIFFFRKMSYSAEK